MLNKTPDAPDVALEHAVEGRVLYLLILIVVVQFAYPLTALGTAALITYQFLYASLIVVGIIVGRDSPRHMIFPGVTGLTYLVAGLLYSFNPTASWLIQLTYVALIPHQTMVVYILLRFIFLARIITRDVIYAATVVYLLLGGVFVPVFGLLESTAPGSFRDGSTPDAPIQWQQLIYFSYTTLTTAGYGDVLPIYWWARSLANLEMVIGALYITIIMARLVGLYTSARAA